MTRLPITKTWVGSASDRRLRIVRVHEGLWLAAKRLAAAQNPPVTIMSVVDEALREYLVQKGIEVPHEI